MRDSSFAMDSSLKSTQEKETWKSKISVAGVESADADTEIGCMFAYKR